MKRRLSLGRVLLGSVVCGGEGPRPCRRQLFDDVSDLGGYVGAS